MPEETSHNVVAEWVGTDKPDEIVLVSGHLDSWDIGVGTFTMTVLTYVLRKTVIGTCSLNTLDTVGAMDDGGGAMISIMALYALQKLNLRPRRTLRVVCIIANFSTLEAGC